MVAAEPTPHEEEVRSLKAKLQDQELPLPERFRALFALRNIPTENAAEALMDTFDDPSALLRHELAFALGQMEVCPLPLKAT